MAEPKFTAEHVRQKAAKLYQHFGVYAAPQYTAILHAFADRLQEDDALDSVRRFYGDTAPTTQAELLVFLQERANEKGREQGRREVYAEIAKMPPFHEIHGMRGCVFCLAHDEWETDTGTTFTHDADCLYTRARAAVESAQAKS